MIVSEVFSCMIHFPDGKSCLLEKGNYYDVTLVNGKVFSELSFSHHVGNLFCFRKKDGNFFSTSSEFTKNICPSADRPPLLLRGIAEKTKILLEKLNRFSEAANPHSFHFAIQRSPEEDVFSANIVVIDNNLDGEEVISLFSDAGKCQISSGENWENILIQTNHLSLVGFCKKDLEE